MLPAICTAALSAVHGCSELTVTLPLPGHAQQHTWSACMQCNTAHVDMVQRLVAPCADPWRAGVKLALMQARPGRQAQRLNGVGQTCQRHCCN